MKDKACLEKIQLLVRVFFLAVVLSAAISTAAFAAPRAGWNISKKGKITYCQQTASGLKMLKGVRRIDGSWYYFNKKTGVLKTGWITFRKGVRYFEARGGFGVRGRMVTGWKKIGSALYYFDPRTGFRQQKLPKTAKVDADGNITSYGNDRWGRLLNYYGKEAGTNQLLFVEYTGGSKADILFYKKVDGEWKFVFQETGYVGKNGINKVREGDKKTPTGTFTLFSGFGIAPAPGTRPGMPYVHVTRTMYYCADRFAYNQLVDTSKTPHYNCSGEHLIDYTKPYQYGMFLDFNKAHVYKKGSAIFLHCKGNSNYTAGCVAVSKSRMIQILRTVTKGAKICIYRK